MWEFLDSVPYIPENSPGDFSTPGRQPQSHGPPPEGNFIDSPHTCLPLSIGRVHFVDGLPNSIIAMVFEAHENLRLDYIPDDIILPDLILDPRFGRRPLSQSNKSVVIDAPTGTAYDIETLKERTESLAKGLAIELDIEVGSTGVIGLFAPNSVSSSMRRG